MSDTGALEPADHVLAAIAYFSMFLIAFGTLANLFSCFICLRKSLRMTPTFIFYAFMLVSDCFTLYVWNIDHYLLRFYEYQLEELGLFACRFVTFIQITSLQCSAWLLVLMTTERYLSIRSKKLKATAKTVKFSILVAVMLIIIIMSINLGFVLNVTLDSNSTYTNVTASSIDVSCFDAEVYKMHMKFHTYAYSLIPFTLMFIINGLLIHKILLQKRVGATQSGEHKSKRLAASISVVKLTFVFIIMTCPNAVANGFFVPMLFETKDGTAILFATDCLTFSFHSFNYIVLLITNSQFKQEFKAIIYCKPKNSVGTTTMTEYTMHRINVQEKTATTKFAKTNS